MRPAPVTRFVVAGPGHSGTAWLATLLSCAGVPTTHEGVYTLTEPPRPWPPGLAVDVSLAATPHLDRIERALFVVRDPRVVARSFWRGRTFAASCPCHEDGAHLGSPFARWAVGHYNLETGDEAEATVQYVTRACAMAWRAACPLVRVEDSRALAFALANVLRLPVERLGQVLDGPWCPASLNAHGQEGPEREPLDDARLDDLATEFGYPA